MGEAKSPCGMTMFHNAIQIEFKEGTTLELLFQNGEVKSFDVASLFLKYPRLQALSNRSLFLSGTLSPSSNIISWGTNLFLDPETVYSGGRTVRTEDITINQIIGWEVLDARERAGLSQNELSGKTGIYQSTISRMERGMANPSVETLARIARAMDMKLEITFTPLTKPD